MIPRDLDVLNLNLNTMIAIARLSQDVLGTGPIAAGLPCTPGGGLSVSIGAGSLYAQDQIDATAYGSLGTNTTSILKQGILLNPQSLAVSAPGTSGFSQVFLVEAQYADLDSGNTVLAYYNPSNVNSPYSGPGGNGQAQPTIRQGVINLQVKAGIAATTGTQVAPAADAGYTGLYTVTVANGQTSVVTGNIAVASGAPFFTPISNAFTEAIANTLYLPMYARSTAEINAGVTPTNLTFIYGDLRRYGATGGPAGTIPSTDDSVAFQRALSTGLIVIPQGMAFKVVTTGTTYTGQVTMIGSGPSSQIYCDGVLLNMSTGDGSLFSNFYLDTITTPCVFQRNVVSITSTTASMIGPVAFSADVQGATSGILTAPAYAGGTSYIPGNQVLQSGRIYECIAGTTGNAPPNTTYWLPIPDGTTYTMKFQDGEIRANVTISGTAISWTGALNSGVSPILSAGSLTATLASASSIAAGSAVFGRSVWNNTTITGFLSGNVAVFTDPCSSTDVNAPIQFYDVTFNTGSAAIATVTNTKADGYRPCTINDTDVYSSLTTLQKTQSLIGPIITVNGSNHVIMEKIYGRFIQLGLMNCNYSQVRDCDFKAGLGSNGYGYGGIVFYPTGTARNRGNSAIRNRIREAGNEGIFIMGCSEFICANNFIYGCGDSGIEFYQDGPGAGETNFAYYSGGAGFTSVGNIAIGNYQGALNYGGNGGSIQGFNTVMGSSTGDYGAWSGAAAVGFTGDGWTVSNLFVERNIGAGLILIGNKCTVNGVVARENQIGPYGTYPCVGFEGAGNMISNIRVWQDTNRDQNSPGPVYSMAVINTGGLQAGNFTGHSTSITNIDLRDTQTSAGFCLQLAGNVERFNVHTNGAPYDQGIEALAEVQITYGAVMTPDLSLGTSFYVNISNNTNITIANPINASPNQRWYLLLVNTSSTGNTGTISFGSQYRIQGSAYGTIAQGFKRSSEFRSNGAATLHDEYFRSSADMPQ